MTHDVFNTRGGVAGFAVELADGTVVREDQATWDEIEGPIRSLSLVHLQTGHAWLRLEGYKKFFFSNVGSATRVGLLSSRNDHRGKVLGGCNGDVAVVLEISFDQERPAVKRIDCQASDLTYLEQAYREGV